MVFSYNTGGGGYSTLRSFGTAPYGNDDGFDPIAPLTLVGSTLYGTCSRGNDDGGGPGIVFSIGLDGSDYQILHNFAGQPSDGQAPLGGLTLDGSTLYGTTNNGGNAQQDGIIYSIGLDGSDYQVLYTFTRVPDRANPVGGMVLDGSTLYGTCSNGGESGNEGYGLGTVFSVFGPTPTVAVTPSGSSADYIPRGPAVYVDPGVTASNSVNYLTGATVTINNYQAGDTLNFTNPNGSDITGSYSAGVLTLGGGATPAQYTAALQSVTFSTASTNKTTRSLSIVAND